MDNVYCVWLAIGGARKVEASVYGLDVVIWFTNLLRQDRLLQAISTLDWCLLDLVVLAYEEEGRGMYLFNPYYYV